MTLFEEKKKGGWGERKVFGDPRRRRVQQRSSTAFKRG
jgi:hypothetical protein